MDGDRIKGNTLPELDAEALMDLVNAAIDALPSTKRPAASDDWAVQITIVPHLNEFTAVVVWPYPLTPVSYA